MKRIIDYSQAMRAKTVFWFQNSFKKRNSHVFDSHWLQAKVLWFHTIYKNINTYYYYYIYTERDLQLFETFSFFSSETRYRPAFNMVSKSETWFQLLKLRWYNTLKHITTQLFTKFHYLKPLLMDLPWQIRLIDRLIGNNKDATIADYWKIAGEDDDPVPMRKAVPCKAPVLVASSARPPAEYSNRGHIQLIEEYTKC